ncbi:hypothetical protein B0T16DRAFT_238393 [Cercophora newfieldiana]|uniref:BTB domain-containing protein n=1 Tax=Cercophora newfieldiana TaxID=92897 RepID=A0AA39XSY8_9PEZI|nr:hypothetical protein B0T16DRAFT_238393 [Cercophora newfieldiana]
MTDRDVSVVPNWEPDELFFQYIEQAQIQSSTVQLDPNTASPPRNLPRLSVFNNSDLLNDRIITIVVGEGPTERKWSVHEALLSAKSPYFRDLLNKDDEARKMREVFFRHTQPKMFSMLLQWMYGTTFGPATGPRIFRYAVPDGEDYTVSDYIRLYILGDKLKIVGVKNAAIDAVYGYFNDENASDIRCPSIVDVQLVFESTPADSPMRRLLTANLLFHLFNKKRTNLGSLPQGWTEVMSIDHTVSFALLEMLAEWGWSMGNNVPPMRIKNRQSFHDPIAIDDDEPVKTEPMEE